ncbi:MULTISPECIES: hypothetical protein [unclassified Microcoleus]|uniref:hypothetical protein n=1 Tax=unclassified Microcoleus TaxID=2642155 RepID=UPI002FD2D303
MEKQTLKQENLLHEQGVRELQDLKQVQIFLSGPEVHSLIAAVQLLKTTTRADRIGNTMKVAELAARKLHKSLIPCPNAYTLLDQGWNLTEEFTTTLENEALVESVAKGDRLNH